MEVIPEKKEKEGEKGCRKGVKQSRLWMVMKLVWIYEQVKVSFPLFYTNLRPMDETYFYTPCTGTLQEPFRTH